jgi:hypothetical protein
MKKLSIICAATAFAGTPAHSDANLRKQLSRPPVAVFISAKSPDQIELCAADVVGRSSFPAAYSDGKGGLVIFGFAGMMGPGTVNQTISLIRTNSGTQIEVRTRANQVDEKLIGLLRECG